METIDKFRGTFLSNFWPCRVTLGGVTYPSTENAYVAAKIGAVPPLVGSPQTDLEYAAIKLTICKSGDAKHIGKRFPMVPGWDNKKLDIMRDLLRQKFSREPLRGMLLGTGNATLIEGNTWGDVFWGVCNGRGENHLGRLLMETRDELRGI